MGMTSGSQGKQRAEINVTPMIDVLLVLIIIFMVITPVTSRGLETQIPQESPTAAAEAPRHDIVVTVKEDGTLMLNRELLSLAHLRERLSQLYRSGPDQPIFVRGERGLEFARVAQVIDAAHSAGVNRVALMTN